MSGGSGYDIVIPTVGRRSLSELIRRLDVVARPRPERVVVVDDRPEVERPLRIPVTGLDQLVRVIRSGGRGPAAARNIGWRSCSSPWVLFLDDDVLPGDEWPGHLARDLDLPAHVVGSQARLQVPLPSRRPPTDWERNVAGLATARWATADMAYRRWALELLGGFDERFRSAYREDADLALRVLGAGLELAVGERVTRHPPGPERFLGSVSRQRGNRDDPTMRMVHGPGWRERAGVPSGARRLHLATVAAALIALFSRGMVARSGWMTWASLTSRFAWSRWKDGPRDSRETADMVVSSVLVPFAAVFHWLRGWAGGLRNRGQEWQALGPSQVLTPPLEAVLFDRDGTLIGDVPYNGDPDRVEPCPGAVEVVARLRDEGLLLGVISNQSGVGRHLIAESDVAAVNRRVDEVFGSFDHWQVCPHLPDDRCQCRKPEAGMIHSTVDALGVDGARCVVVGDIGSDVEAARRAGCGHVLVPTPLTLPAEVAGADHLAADLGVLYERLRPHLGDGS